MASLQTGDPFAPRERKSSISQDTNGNIAGPWSNLDAPFPTRLRKKFVLCFDGTGNKFSGTDADSNILKIYRMLDRDDNSQFHYYQPGIGTYVQSSSLSHSSTFDRIKSAYLKGKDSAIGTSFDEHVMGGYKFLMRYYNVGDDIFLFGFSRGAYTARFLAEMLDHVGLLSAGNEEMARFAWKAFQKWQQRTERTDKEKAQKKDQMNYLQAFRETFSRPVRRIRFLGLFDTVNSVPQFENAFLERSKFPYTARSTAKVIRHAVAIDERRAKFRQDLISEVKPSKECKYRRRHHWWDLESKAEAEDMTRGRSSIASRPPVHKRLEVPMPFRDPSETTGVRSLSRNTLDDHDQHSLASHSSQDSLHMLHKLHGQTIDEDSDDEEQDIQEVWFPGCHADIGGGWPLTPGEDTALAHIPLVWMVREAEGAGLKFDPKKVRDLNCCEEFASQRRKTIDAPGGPPIPQIEVEQPTPGFQREEPYFPAPYSDLIPPKIKEDNEPNINGESAVAEGVNGVELAEGVNGVELAVGASASSTRLAEEEAEASHFERALDSAARKGRIHDVLCFNNGSDAINVLVWNFMEYLPFRRMDLQPDGSWKSINWPLPKGEVRDIPDDVIIHSSVVKRMKADPEYRPGNLIIGGGGRGVRKAPEEYGIGNWKILREEGDPVGEVWVRDGRPPLPPSTESTRSKIVLSIVVNILSKVVVFLAQLCAMLLTRHEEKSKTT